MATLFVTPNVAIDESELEFSFARASGPGGQNVNKIARFRDITRTLTG